MVRARDAAKSADRELLDRLLRADSAAYDELYRRHADAVRRYARTCCRDADTADDLTNEVFAATLQAVRGGTGPRTAVRAYLLTSVRRVAATWARSARRELLVEDFAVFAVSATGLRAMTAGEADTVELGPDVRALHQAERSLAVQAFHSLPERWQTVLWHTAVEESSPREVAPLLGLTPNATAVLAHRAREGLKQAYLQAHVSRSLTSGGACTPYADQLGAFARGRLRARAERGLRRHLAECAECRAAASEISYLNEHIRAVLPVAVIGWFAAGYTLRAAAVPLAGVGGGAAGGGALSSGGSAGGQAGSPGLGGPVTTGIATGVLVTAVVAALALLLTGGQTPEPPGSAKPPGTAPVPRQSAPGDAAREPVPAVPPASHIRPEPVTEAAPIPPDTGPVRRSVPQAEPAPSPPAEPEPVPEPSWEPPPEPPRTPPAYELRQLEWDLFGEGDQPAVRTTRSGWMWQRERPSIGGRQYAHGGTVHPPSSVTIDLNRECVTFRAVVGIDDLVTGVGAAVFSVHGDGAMLWSSTAMRGGEAGVPLEVPLSSVRTLRLDVQGDGGQPVAAMATWADAEIDCR